MSAGATPRRERVLRQREAFGTVLQEGLKLSSRNFVLRALHTDLDHARLGIVAGRRAAPRAVDRNRAKRLIREVFLQEPAAFGACDVTVQLRSNLREESNGAVRAELRRLRQALERRST